MFLIPSFLHAKKRKESYKIQWFIVTADLDLTFLLVMKEGAETNLSINQTKYQTNINIKETRLTSESAEIFIIHL